MIDNHDLKAGELVYVTPATDSDDTIQVFQAYNAHTSVLLMNRGSVPLTCVRRCEFQIGKMVSTDDYGPCEIVDFNPSMQLFKVMWADETMWFCAGEMALLGDPS